VFHPMLIRWMALLISLEDNSNRVSCWRIMQPRERSSTN